MSTQTIHVEIDDEQLKAQKRNNYNLYLAKMVNGVYTTIWKSQLPNGGPDSMGYGPRNAFDITIPSYKINYTDTNDFSPGLQVTTSGEDAYIEVGQETTLDENGLFSSATQGTKGVITVNNQCQGYPHEVLKDHDGNKVFVNVASGMIKGKAQLTPKDCYQVWFGNHQENGTIIADNRSNIGEVEFAVESEKTISFSKDGTWINSPLKSSSKLSLSDEEKTAFNELRVALGDSIVKIVVAFTPVITAALLTYLTNNLINKFSSDLKPKKITTDGKRITIEFSDHTKLLRSLLGDDVYLSNTKLALSSAKSDPNFHLKRIDWSTHEIK